MSLSVTTGAGSLVNLGLGISDVTTLVNLSRLAGNWVSASSGDKDLLDMLQEDENNFVLRRGVFDVFRFRSRWSQSLRLLSNGRTEVFEGPLAEGALGECNRFTAIMICITGAVNAFNTNVNTLSIVRKLLIRLINADDRADEVIGSQVTTRVNAWRSAACVRGLTTHIARARGLLMDRKSIEDGFMPTGDVGMMTDFLFWLVGETSETYWTSSSDVAGVAYCLTFLGFDILRVKGLPNIEDDPERIHGCLLVYNRTPLPRSLASLVYASVTPERRQVNTVVPLLHPEESVSSFPISTALANRARAAWMSGSKAGSFLSLQPMILDYDAIKKAGFDYDVRYAVISTGSEPPRVSIGIHKLASALSFNANAELVSALHAVVGDMTDENLEKLYELIGHYPITRVIGDFTCTMADADSFMEKFTEFQAFFMGYYYEVLLRLVDTSELDLQCVDGMWGFASNYLLAEVCDIISKSKRFGLTRELIIRLLSLCCLGYQAPLEKVGHERFSWCLGVVHNRALVTNGLVGESDTPLGACRFKLFDADTGGIPTDIHGLIRPGDGDWLEHKQTQSVAAVYASGPPVDLTKHIEVDWGRDPRRLLLCFRYNGRRIATINPTLADMRVCASYTEPVNEPDAGMIDTAVSCTLQNLQEGAFPYTIIRGVPLVILSKGRPNMRYGVAGMLPYFDPVGISSNSIKAALDKAQRDIQRAWFDLAETTHPVVIC